MAMFIGGAVAGRSGGPSIPFGRTRDVSRSGLFVITDARPVVGALVALSIVWGDETFSCDATVIRHAGEGIGLRFVEPAPRFRYVIEEILRDAVPLEPGVSAGAG